MWTVIRYKKKNLNILKGELLKKLGNDTIFYIPKIKIENSKKKEDFFLLSDYLLCFNKSFNNINIFRCLSNIKGLKYFLENYFSSQKDIKMFIEKCKSFEDKDGYITQNFFNFEKNERIKFLNGPFANMIFKIIDINRSKIKILMGDIKTTIPINNFNFIRS